MNVLKSVSRGTHCTVLQNSCNPVYSTKGNFNVSVKNKFKANGNDNSRNLKGTLQLRNKCQRPAHAA